MRTKIFTYFLSLLCPFFIAADDVAKKDLIILANAFQQFLPYVDVIEATSLCGGSDTIRKKFYCTVNGKKYIACMLSASYSERKKEVETHLQAMKHGIAPTLYYYDSDYTIEIMDFIEGQTLSIMESAQPYVLEEVAQAVYFLGTLKLDIPQKKLFACIHNYYDELMTRKSFISELLIKAMQALEPLENYVKAEDYAIVVCHSDLHPRNLFFQQQKLLIIDWEEAALCYEFFDLSCYSIFANLNDTLDLYLLQKYLQHTPTQREIKKFRVMKLIVRLYDALGMLSRLENIHEFSSLEPQSLKSYSYYEAIFANDPDENSSDFFYRLGLSQLLEFLKQTGSL